MIAAAEGPGEGRWKWTREALTGLVESRGTKVKVHAATPKQPLNTS